MPRLTSRVFTDLAIWMAGFGLLIGLIFPPFCLILGLPADRVMSPLFYASTMLAGLVVGRCNFGLARLVVGRRLRLLADRMGPSRPGWRLPYSVTTGAAATRSARAPCRLE